MHPVLFGARMLELEDLRADLNTATGVLILLCVLAAAVCAARGVFSKVGRYLGGIAAVSFALFLASDLNRLNDVWTTLLGWVN